MKRFLWKLIKWFFGILVGIMLTISLLLYFFKDDVIAFVIQEANKNLTTKITVSKIDLTFWATFPNVSLDFENVFIQDPTSKPNHPDTLLYSDLIRLKFDPLDVWNEKYAVKKLDIHPGCLHVKMDSLGNPNYHIIRSNPQAKNSSFKFELEDVQLHQFLIAYENQQTGQQIKTRFQKLNLAGNFSDKQFKLKAKSQLTIQEIKSEKVALVSDKKAAFDFTISVNTQKGIITIPPTVIAISDIPFQFSANYAPNKLKLDLAAHGLRLQEVATKLSRHLNQLEAFDGKGTCNFKLKIIGNDLSHHAPAIRCDFDILNGSLREPTNQLYLSSIFLHGNYSNQNEYAQEQLKIWDLRLNSPSGPFQGAFAMTHFSNPHYEGKAKGSIDLESIHTLFNLPNIDKISGKISGNGQFEIQTVPSIGNQSSAEIIDCKAALKAQNIQFKLINDPRTFKQINGNVAIDNEEVGVQALTLQVGNSDLKINGIFQQVGGYLQGQNKLVADVEIESRMVDLADLSDNSESTTNSTETKDFVFPKSIQASVLLSLGKLTYEKHTFKDIQANMLFEDRVLNIPQFQVQNANALVQGNLKITEQNPGFMFVRSDLKSENIVFKNIFKEWNNFDQQVIQEENISGNAQIGLHVEAPFHVKTGIVKSAIKANVHVKITNGALKNVSTFRSITENLKTSPAKLVLKKRTILDFEQKLLDLKFQTLENTFTIEKSKVTIPWMEIKSNALAIEMSGWHTFSNQIDYHFAFLYRDLLSAPKETEFGIEEDDGTGVKLFMRMYGTVENAQFDWDSKARKEQAKENREAAKQEALSILKTEFGFRKNDTTIGVYQPIKKPTEELRIEFNQTQETPQEVPKKESEMQRKLKEKLKKLKESTKEEEIKFEVE
jgi:hypothetical protein